MVVKESRGRCEPGTDFRSKNIPESPTESYGE